MVSSEGAIRAAREVGADSVPQAALHLKLSEEQVTKAKAMIASGDNEHADSSLQRAQADAELAISRSREIPGAKRSAATPSIEVKTPGKK